METIETNPSPQPSPQLPLPILVVWICPNGELPGAAGEFWKKWSQENEQEVEQRFLTGAVENSDLASQAASEVPSDIAEAANDRPDREITPRCPVGTWHWGQTFNTLSEERPWKGIVILPVWQNPQSLSQDLVDCLTAPDLDGVTFYREGAKAPFPIGMWRCFVTRPLSFLLEIPWNDEADWLGWKNWFWEMMGAWFFGVKNRDPLFPCRAFKGKLFQQIEFQSQSAWVWMEMLAKLHFLGARLSERKLTRGEGAVVSDTESIAMKDVNLVFRKPHFKPSGMLDADPIGLSNSSTGMPRFDSDRQG